MTERTVTVYQLLRESVTLPPQEAEYLLLHALGRPLHERAWLRAHGDDDVPAAVMTAFDLLRHRRLSGEPVAYLTGQKAFYGLTLQVDPRVLDPRPDTETLVDWALSRMPPTAPTRVVDLGTGSGAIALAIAQQRPHAEVTAVDASTDALSVCEANAHRHGLTLRIRHGHWLNELIQENACFDLVVSNPPYIAAGDPHLNALHHEPLGALVSGPDGLDDLRTLIQDAPRVLASGGWLLLEHGHDQAAAVAQLMRSAGFTEVQHRKDLAGVDRCTGGQWVGEAETR